MIRKKLILCLLLAFLGAFFISCSIEKKSEVVSSTTDITTNSTTSVITTTSNATKELISISLDTQLATKNYYIGSEVNFDGILVCLNYSDGSTRTYDIYSLDVTYIYDIDIYKEGSYDITIKYLNFSDKYTVTYVIPDIKSIYATAYQDEKYYIGYEYKPLNVKVYGMMDDCSINITNLCTFDIDVENEICNVYYESFSTNYDLEVLNKTLDIEVQDEKYALGEVYEPSKNVSVSIYNYDGKQDVSSSATYEVDTTSLGTKIVNVSYTINGIEIKGQYTIEVVETMCGVSYSHDLILDEQLSIEPTCTEPGINYFVCKNCGYIGHVEVEALGHDYDEDGICKRCNDVKEVYIKDYFSSSVKIYSSSATNPYNIDLTKYGSNVSAIFYSPMLSVMLDPYYGITSDKFYSDYTKATSYEDSYYRTYHNFISGTIEDQTHLTNSLVTSKDMMLRATDALYILDTKGNYLGYIPNQFDTKDVIFYKGAYIGLNEVATYLLAFGEVPSNSDFSSKSTGDSVKAYGIYGRANNATFSGNTSKYPYEPLLTNISGENRVAYTETDFGSQGGFLINGAIVKAYNNGNSITRGTCRFVFVSDRTVKNIDQRHVFYTYNHYNDFEEYLNYYNGFGLRFGNESVGNKYNRADYDNPPSNPGEYILTTFSNIKLLFD